MSALARKADMCIAKGHVRFWPEPDIVRPIRSRRQQQLGETAAL
jgi:hypothetical protein